MYIYIEHEEDPHRPRGGRCCCVCIHHIADAEESTSQRPHQTSREERHESLYGVNVSGERAAES